MAAIFGRYVFKNLARYKLKLHKKRFEVKLSNSKSSTTIKWKERTCSYFGWVRKKIQFASTSVQSVHTCPVVAWDKKVPFLLDKIVNSLADITYWRPVQSFEELSLYSPCFSRQQTGKQRAVLRRKVPFVHALVGDYPGSVDQTSSGDGPSCFEWNEGEAFLFLQEFRNRNQESEEQFR